MMWITRCMEQPLWRAPEEDERPLGVPGIPPAAGAKDSASASQPQSPSSEKTDATTTTGTATTEAPPPLTSDRADRPGDSGLGVPLAVAREARILTDEEIAQLEAEEERLAKEDAQRLLEDLEHRFYGFEIPKWLRTPLILGAVALAGLFGIFVVAQVTSTLSTIQTLPTWSQYVVIGAMVFFAVLILYVFLRLTRFLFVLRRNRQVRIAALIELQRRQGWHTMQLARIKLNEAQRELKAYLESYTLDDAHAKQLERAGLKPADIERLRQEREQLLEPNLDPGAEAWIDNFQRRFQSVIDAAADERIRSASLRGGVLTAAAPYPVFDMAIVLWTSFQVVGDMCAMYNLKAGRFQNVMILAKVIVTAYIAGNLQNLTQEAGSAIAREQVMQEQLGRLGANLFGGAVARMGEGTVNALLLRRLGRTTRHLVQPVAPARRK